MNIPKDTMQKLEAMLSQFERMNNTVTKPAAESINGLCNCGGSCFGRCIGSCKGTCHVAFMGSR